MVPGNNRVVTIPRTDVRDFLFGYFSILGKKVDRKLLLISVLMPRLQANMIAAAIKYL